MCSSCGTGRSIGPWEDAFGVGREHRVARARALTRLVGSSAVRFSADAVHRSYLVHRATGPLQTAYDVDGCLAAAKNLVRGDLIAVASFAEVRLPPGVDGDQLAVAIALHARWVRDMHVVTVTLADQRHQLHIEGRAVRSVQSSAGDIWDSVSEGACAADSILKVDGPAGRHLIERIVQSLYELGSIGLMTRPLEPTHHQKSLR